MKAFANSVFLTGIIFLLLYPCEIKAQEEELSIAVDTSYFREGEDDWNLLESVIKSDSANSTMLLSRGANPNSVSTTGNTALIYATEKGNMAIMKLLIEYGADVNTPGFNNETPLFIAIFNNDFQSAKYLLEQGADPNLKDDFGVTPLIYAAATNQYQSADLLMFYEADPKVTDKEKNDPLLAAVTFEHLETADVLLQNGLDPDVQDKNGDTPAIVATQHGTYSLLQLLIEYKADLNIANNKEYTPLAYAITYKDVKMARLLVENGANVNHEVENGRSILELARLSGNDSLVSLITENGGKIAPGLDFSEFQFLYGNSFNSTDYLMQFRGGLVDSKRAFFLETGIDFRPFLLKVQNTENDTTFQYRERRIGWSHGIGKYFRIYESGIFKLFAYGSVNGFLSFPNYMGTSLDPGISYKIIPSAGIGVSGRYLGLKAGADWYNFESMLDKGLKVNITAFFRISYPDVEYDRKEIYW